MNRETKGEREREREREGGGRDREKSAGENATDEKRKERKETTCQEDHIEDDRSFSSRFNNRCC